MSWTELLEIINSNFIFSYESNGLHIIKQYLYKNNYIKYSEYIRLKNMGIQVKTIQHLGFKLSINNTFEVISLFTSSENTYFMNNIAIQNYKIDKHGFKYINYPIIVSKSNFAEFITIIDNYNYIPNSIKNKELDPKSDIDRICKFALNSFNECINYYNLLNPTLVHDTLAEYYLNLNKNSPFYIQMHKKVQIINTLEYKDCYVYQNNIINEYEIFNFIEKIKVNKNIRNEIITLNNFKI